MTPVYLSDLVEMKRLQAIADSLFLGAGMPVGIIDALDDAVLVAAGWQEICLNFHRVHPETLTNCRESDRRIKAVVSQGESLKYKCKNGMWDIGIPIMVRGSHLATIFFGQFFYEDEIPDPAFFKRRAAELGFDEAAYMAALSRVPRFSREKVAHILEYNASLARFIEDLAEKEMDRVASDRELVATRQHYQNLVENITDWVWEMDNTGVYTYCSPRITTILGYAPREMLKKDFSVLMPAEEGRRFKRMLYEDTMRGRHIEHAVHSCIHKNGTVRILETNASPVFDDTGTLTGYRGISRDATRRVKTREDLEKREAQLQSIFRASPTGIGMVVDRRLTWVNRKMWEITGYEENEMMGQSARMLYPDDETYKKVGREKYEQISRKGTGTVETVFQCKDGALKDILLSSTPIDTTDWEKGVTFTALDITTSKNTQKKLLEYQEDLEQKVSRRTTQLEAKNRELETFTYSVSHDLKAPLRGIEGYSRLLVEGYRDQLDDEGQLFIDYVRKSTTQMNQLIEDLLAYSRMERRCLQNREINIKELIGLLLDERRHDIEKQGIRIQRTLALETIYSDYDSLRQILGNLLDNAIKFTKNCEQPTVDIGGEALPDSLRLWVKDNGIGFSPEYNKKIFHIFQRLEYSEDYPGTGIGLAMVKKAVQRINGEITVQASPGKGAAFYIEIPVTYSEK